jgi:phosphoribosylformylglycinamidine cyclo-ligase
MAEAGEQAGLTYAASGVSLEAAESVVGALGRLAASTRREGVEAGIGGFAGLFRVGGAGGPLLAACTDGVGTKCLVARDAGSLETVGIDLVAMCVDDLVCVGARPLFFLDYVAVGKLVPERVERLVAGVAEGCRQAGAALLGGETAEHPGGMAPEDFDLAGFAVGVVDPHLRVGPEAVEPGDLLVGIGSPGLRSNGYSLARRALLELAGRRLDEPAWPGSPRSLGAELLVPSVVYAPAAVELFDAAPGALHALAHVTGGGICHNLARSLPASLGAEVRAGTWPIPRIFAEVAEAGEVAPEELARVTNLGIGMVLVVDPRHVERVVAHLRGRGLEAGVVGEVVPRAGARLVGRIELDPVGEWAGPGSWRP